MSGNLTFSFNVGNNGVSFGDNTVAGIFADTFDPSTGAGQAAPVGSLFMYSAGTLFIKTGVADTGWSALGSTVTNLFAGLGLYYTGGNTLNVSTVNPSRITVAANGVDLATTGVSGGTYTKVTVDQYGRVVLGGLINDVDVVDALGYMPAQQNGQSIALFDTSTTGIYVITGPMSSATRTIVVPQGMSIANPDGVAGNPTISLTSNLLSIENLNTSGLTVNTNGLGFSTVELIAPVAGFTITNEFGIGGNPTFTLTDDLAGLEGLNTTGIAVRTAASTWATTLISGTPDQIKIANGDGISGSPSNTQVTGIVDHPGILSLGTGTANTNSTRIHLGVTAATGVILPNQVEYFAFLIRIPTITTLQVTIGLGQDISSLTFGTDGVWFQFNPATSANLQFTSRAAGVAQATVTNTLAVTANTWYLCEAFYNGTTWTPVVNGVQYTALTTQLPSTVAVNVGAAVAITAGSSRTLHLDYFAMYTRELGARYS